MGYPAQQVSTGPTYIFSNFKKIDTESPEPRRAQDKTHTFCITGIIIPTKLPSYKGLSKCTQRHDLRLRLYYIACYINYIGYLGLFEITESDTSQTFESSLNDTTNSTQD